VEETVTPQLLKEFAIRLQATEAPPVFCKSERVNTLNFYNSLLSLLEQSQVDGEFGFPNDESH